MKWVVTDMDGTLIHHGCISPKNLQAIRLLEEHGIELMIASGRDFHGVKTILDPYQIRCQAILGNGAQFCDEDGHIIQSCYLSNEVLEPVTDLFEKYQIPYMIFTEDGFFTGYDPQYVKEAFIQRGIALFHEKREQFEPGGLLEKSPCLFLQFIPDKKVFLKQNHSIIKIEAFSIDPSLQTIIKEQLAKLSGISFLSSFHDNIEVTDALAQKGLILKSIAIQQGISDDEIAVIGDGMNDLTLFENFKYSYAVKNAHPYIQSLAYKIVASCDQDGVSEAVDDLLKR